MKIENENRVGFLQVILSVLAALFGVQNHEKHQRDFEHGDPVQFIVVGILLVAMFVLSLVWLVNFIIK